MSLSSDKPGFVRVKERYPRKGKGPENLIIQLEEFFANSENKWTQKIVIEAGKDFLHIEKLVPKESSQADTEVTVHQAVRHKPMDELSEKYTHPHAFVMSMFEEINKQGYEVSHILVGETTLLYKWASVPRKLKRLFGVPISATSELPEDVLIVCGSVDRVADPEDIEYSVKGTML